MTDALEINEKNSLPDFQALNIYNNLEKMWQKKN
jgi:hypothetical protein